MRHLKKIISITIIATLVIPMAACHSLTQYARAIDYLRSGDISELSSRVENAIDNISGATEYLLNIGEVIMYGAGGKVVTRPDNDEDSAEEEAVSENNSPEGNSVKTNDAEKNDVDESSIIDKASEGNGTGKETEKPVAEESGKEKDDVPAIKDKSIETDDALEAEDNSSKTDGAFWEEFGKKKEKTAADDNNDDYENDNDNDNESAAVLPEYEHYDQADFDAIAEVFSTAVKEGDAEGAETAYFEMAEALEHIYTMDAVAGINFSKDVTDEEANEESIYSDELLLLCADEFYTLCKDALNSDIEEEFRSFAHEVVIKDAEEYEPMTDEQKTLVKKESELSNKYDTLYYELDSMTYTYNDTDYAFSYLYEDISPLNTLYFLDKEGYYEVYDGLMKAANDLLGPLFLELLDLRLDIADSYGYDNFTDYAYAEIYFRDYTPREAQRFCDVIKKTAAAVYPEEVYPYGSYQFYSETEFSEEEILSAIDTFTAEMDPELNNAFNEMVDSGLYDYGNADTRSEGSYTTIIPEIRKPFVFISGDGDLQAFMSFAHEFGHFFDFYTEFSKDPEVFFRSDNLDLAEICSNGLQLQMSHKYSEAMSKDDAYAGKTSNVENMFSQIIEGCMFDEFQRRIYADPANLTVDDINDIFADVLYDYRMDEFYSPYMWVLIPHTFQSPLYYFSYAVSALASLEIWNISMDSEEDAYKAWMDVVELEQDTPYIEAFEELPLTPFTDSEGVENICMETIANLKSLRK